MNFRAKYFYLNDVPRSNRCVENDSDQIIILFENNQHSAVENKVKILKSNSENH